MLSHKTPTRYRNRFLAEAMVNLRMIDTMGFGIHDIMFLGQARRYFPLPDFDLTDSSHVVLQLSGRFIDENYSRALLTESDLSWSDIVTLDRIQKGLPPTDEQAVQSLRRRRLIEGRKPLTTGSLPVSSPAPKPRPITFVTGRSTTITMAS